jgi:threonine aldolase
LGINLSKGLCAPAGSVLLGPRDFIERARRFRQMLGGSLSQSGILAAAGIVALEKMTGRLWQDHENARYLAGRLQELPGITVDTTRADINFVFFSIRNTIEIIERMPEYMLANGIKISAGKNGVFRFALHHDITREDVDFVIRVLSELLSK